MKRLRETAPVRTASLRAVAAIMVYCAALLLHAHPISVALAEISITPGMVLWKLHIPAADMDTFFAIDKNGDGFLQPAELQSAADRVHRYLAAKVQVEEDGHALAPSLGPLQMWMDADGNPYVETTVAFALPDRGVQRLTLSADLLREVTPSYKTIAAIKLPDRQEQWIFEGGGENGAAGAPYELTFGAPGHPLSAFALFVRMGVLHIFTGYDHIAFLLGVVLMGGTFRAIVKIVTSFTVAHSITLALAAFDIVQIPSRIVESGIALSIMYIACENLFFKNFDRRWIVTFFFGLIHGFGFAGALREVHLSRGLLGTALFSFNLGVELGQVAIVALLLPCLLWLRRQSYSQAVIRGMSLAIFALGSFWLWQRLGMS